MKINVNIQFWENNLSKRRKSGGDSAVDTPVPIPNTEVKHCSGEDSPYGQK